MDYILTVDFGDEKVFLLIAKDQVKRAIDAAKEDGALIISIKVCEPGDTVFHWEKIKEENENA